MKTIKEILGDQYSDFMEYCTTSEKSYPSDISPSDYVAFRVQYRVSREYVNGIKDKINSGEVCKADAIVFDVPKTVEIVETMNDGSSVDVQDKSTTIKENTAYDDIEDTDEDKPVQNESVDDAGIVNAEVEDIIHEENNKTIPYDIHMPLYVALEIANPEKYSNISIDAMGLKSRIERILKEGRRESVLDVLQSSIAQLFDFNNIARTSIANIIEQIKRFVFCDGNSLEMKLRQVSIPLYKLFNVEDVEQYKDVSVKSVDFGKRFSNALNEKGVDTMSSLLRFSIDDLLKWEHLGSTTIREVVRQLDDYLSNYRRKIINVKNNYLETQKLREKIVAIIDAEIKGEPVPCDDLNEKELALYSRIKEGIDVCGEEFYVEIKKNPDYAKVLGEVLREYYIPILEVLEKKNKIFQDYFLIPLEFRNKSAKLLYKVYELRTRRKMAFLDRFDELITISELVNEVRNDEIVEYYQSLEYFLQWIKNIDVNNTVQEIFSRDALTSTYKVDESLKDKYWLVLEMRAEGETLENIGSLIDATRERVRQIEKKYTKQFAVYYQNNKYDLLAVIHALRGGDNVLSKSEVQAIIGEKYTNLLWLVLSKELLDCDLYRYSKAYDAVLFIEGNQNNAENLRHINKELPEMFFAEELEELIDYLSEKFGVSKELIMVDIQRRYTKYGTLYSQSSPTVAFMCRYILKTRFPNGFKTGDATEAKRFQTYLIEVFGDKKGKMTARALDAKIGKVGVLCDRGKYLHPDYLHVEKWIIDEINAFIESNEKTVVTYSEVFDELRTVLSSSQITNRFILQGALKFYGCKYKLTRDYITKEKGKSLTDEFEDFAKGCGEFHKSDFFVAFPSMTDANLGMLIGRCPNVFSIDNGYYMHSSVLHLIDKDYDEIRKYLDNVCSDCPANSRYLFEEFSYKFIDFMTRNEITNHTKLFGILYYMFGNEFIFSRPYITKEENTSLTNRDVILRCLDGFDTITIEDTIAMCQERGIRYMSSGYLIRQISPYFIRINETTLMRYELTGINDDVILEVAAYVANRVETNKYCSVATIKDLLWFPTISIEWTSHLVESIMFLSGDMIGRISIPTSNLANLTSIYVSEEYTEDDYATFVLKILDSAFEKGFFTTKVELREFLSEKGLINNNSLPNFLEGTEYYYMDEEGILRRRR